ncbi:MAG: hypothetical protein U0174_20700 [Polyangiaceae bacterium]
MKTLNLNLRRVRTSTRTDVSTGSRKSQSGILVSAYCCQAPSQASPQAPTSNCLQAPNK